MELGEENYTLKFLGTGPGSGVDHTNAWFMPDPETLVFVDMSIVHMNKVHEMLAALKHQVKQVCLCVTHCHPDHISGVTNLTFLVRHYFPDTVLEIYTETSVQSSLERILYATGAGRPGLHHGVDGYYRFKHTFTSSRPYWLRQVIRTKHAPNLPGGAVGFVFQTGGVFAIYSGDTCDPTPFFEAETLVDYPFITTELYLDIATSDRNGLHRVWDHALERELANLLRQRPKLSIVFMHYSNRGALAKKIRECRRFTPEMRERIFIAEAN